MKNCKFLLLPLFAGLALKAHSQELNNVIVKSDVFVSQQRLLDKISPLLGQEIDVRLLNKLLTEISAFYKNQGYLGAQAFFPQQESTDGVLEVYVDTAKLNEIVIHDQSSTKKSTLYSLLSKARILQGKDINSNELNSALLRIRDLNVYDISGYFERVNANSDDNIVNLNLDIRQKKRFSFQTIYDNYGSSTAGKNRFSAVFRSHNLTKHADSAAFLASVSDKGQSSFLFNYEIPVSSHPSVFGTKLSYGHYDLKEEYAQLGAQGSALTAEAYIKEPLIRDSENRLDMTTSVYFKSLEDKLKTYSISFKKLDYGLREEFFLENRFGKLNFEHTLGANVGRIKNQSSLRYQKDRSFLIGSLSSVIQYRFTDNYYVKNTLSVQIANQTLDSSDKFIPGGAYAVGAFENNIASSDSGIFDDLRVGTLFNYNSILLNSYFAFEQAYAQNRSKDKESFYGLALGIEGNYRDFFVNTSLNKAIGHNSEYAKEQLKLLVKFGYKFV